MEEMVGLVSIFIVLPSLILSGYLARQWFKLKNAELELRREELEIQKKKIEFLTADARNETLKRLDQEL